MSKYVQLLSNGEKINNSQVIKLLVRNKICPLGVYRLGKSILNGTRFTKKLPVKQNDNQSRDGVLFWLWNLIINHWDSRNPANRSFAINLIGSNDFMSDEFHIGLIRLLDKK